MDRKVGIKLILLDIINNVVAILLQQQNEF
jgi:hypothetical protein